MIFWYFGYKIVEDVKGYYDRDGKIQGIENGRFVLEKIVYNVYGPRGGYKGEFTTRRKAMDFVNKLDEKTSKYKMRNLNKIKLRRTNGRKQKTQQQEAQTKQET